MFNPWVDGSAYNAGAFGIGAFFIALLFFVIAVWSFVWKAFALWYAARNKQRLWFIALLVINTVGLLEIAYLVWFRKENSGADTLVSDSVKNSVKDAMPKKSETKVTKKEEDLPVAESSPAE